MRRAGVLLLMIAVAAGAAAIAFAAQSPNELRASIFSAARAEHSVHYVDIGAAQGLTQRMVGDVGATRGIQRISLTVGKKKGSFTVIVVGRDAYIRGNAVALHDYLGYTTKQASMYHDRWISVPPSSSKFKEYAASVTLPSYLQDIYPQKSLALATTKVGSQDITGVRGSSVLFGTKVVLGVFPGSPSSLLPRAVAEVDPKHGFIAATRISRWNEPVNVKAPANAVPISTVAGS